MIDDDILAFIQSSIKSVWALELLIFMRGNPRTWKAEELVRELRSSDMIVSETLATFTAAGLVSAVADDAFQYAPATTELDRLTRELEKAYAERPRAVVRAIITAPNEKLQTFAAAFRLRKD